MLLTDTLHSVVGSEYGRVMVAVWTAEQGHILYKPEYWHVDLLEHIDAFHCILDR